MCDEILNEEYRWSVIITLQEVTFYLTEKISPFSSLRRRLFVKQKARY
jgi:hypothetical protein